MGRLIDPNIGFCDSHFGPSSLKFFSTFLSQVVSPFSGQVASPKMVFFWASPNPTISTFHSNYSTDNPMLHVPINIRAQIPSPTLSPTVEQIDFIPREDTAPIVIESVQQQPETPTTMSPAVGSPNLHSNILTQSMDSAQVSEN